MVRDSKGGVSPPGTKDKDTVGACGGTQLCPAKAVTHLMEKP